MKVAFWVGNSGFQRLDCSNVSEGNPGIGGTQFSAILIADSLRKFGIETMILCPCQGIFPKGQQFHVCLDISNGCRYVQKNHYDFFVLDSRDISQRLLYTYPSVKFIAWANCFIEEWMNEVFPKFNNLVSFVNVGKQQCKMTSNMPIAPKSTFIYNAVPTAILQKVLPTDFDKRKHWVVYIGSLHRAKGFHLLARQWKTVLSKVPDAELFVIGSGNLYSRNGKLGKWGIAQKEYEDEFMPYLTIGEKLLPSVHFMGVMGNEKYELLSKCKVGVPNPSGISETFGYTAVEMQIMGCAVTTKKYAGYIDTVFNVDNLYENENELGMKICSLLNSSSNDYDSIMTKVQIFSVENVCKQWIKLLKNLNTRKEPVIVKSSFKRLQYRLEDNYKWLKMILKRKIKQ